MKILIIPPSWIGDIVMSQSLYKTIKLLHINTNIEVLAPKIFHPLLARMPEIDRIKTSIQFQHGKLEIKQRYLLGKILRNDRYDRAYILPNSFKSALLPFFASIKRRIGWRGEMRYILLNDIRILKKNAFPLMVQRYIALAHDTPLLSAKKLSQPLLLPHLQIKKEEKIKIASNFKLTTKNQVIAFCPGSEFGPAKQWPHYHYAALAKKLILDNYHIILLGSIKDIKIGKSIVFLLKKNKQFTNLIGKTNLDQAILLLANCKAVVTNDSGLMHITAALNIPLLALYGPTSPNFTPPLSKNACIIHLNKKYYKIRRTNNEFGYHETLINIKPQDVYKKINNLLQLIKF